MQDTTKFNQVRDWVFHFLRDHAESFLIGLGVALIFRFLVFSSYQVSQESMAPNLMAGDLILSYDLPYLFNERVYPERGSIVVFQCPHQKNGRCVKRLIGLPGDRIEMVQGRLSINGIPMSVSGTAFEGGYQEKFGPHQFRVLSPKRMQNAAFGPEIVPPNTFYVMSDTREDDKDSRFYGAVSRRALKGKVFMIWASFDAQSDSFRSGRRFHWLD